MRAAAAIDAIRIDWLADPSALAALEHEWRRLEGLVRQRTHVSSFDFLATWYTHYAGAYGGQPLVGVAWRGAELVGVAPLTARRGTLGRVPVTRVDFAPNDSIAGEFLVRDDLPGLVPAFLDSLARHVTFDVICLNGFEPGATPIAAVRAAAARRRLSIEIEDHACAMVDLTGGYDRYWATRSGNTRRKILQKTRRIDAMGARIDDAPPGNGDVDERIRRMIAVNEASYKLQGRRLADHHRNFLAELATRFAARGTLSLPILSIGGRDAAFILGVIDRGCFYDVGLAYDESFASLGPGVYLMQQLLRRLADAGVHTVISHGAHEYKRHWATGFVPQQRVFLFPARPRAMAARLARFGVQPLWQRIAAHVRPATRGSTLE